MKKIIISGLTLLMALCAAPVMAQRNLPGEKSLLLSAGWVDGLTLRKADGRYAYYGSFGYMATVKNHRRWKFAANYLQKDYLYLGRIVPKSQFTGEAGFYMPVAGDRRRYVSLNAGLAALAGYETVNRGEKLMHDGALLCNGDRFVYGGALAAEVESYLTDRLIFTVSVRQNALMGSTVGKWHTLLGFGLRFVIN